MKKELKNRKFYYAAAVLLLLVSGCGGLEIKSLWKDQEIKIDGKNDEWKNGTYIKDANCSIYASNDDKNLYLCIVSSDRDLVRKVMVTGLTVWVESSKEKDNRFGIHFPLGIAGRSRAAADDNSGIDQQEASRSRERRPQEGGSRPADEEKMFSGANEYELLNKDENVEGRYSLSEDNGLKMKTGMYQGLFVYELKIPITPKGGSLTSVAADLNSDVKIEFASGKMDMERFRQARRSEMAPRTGEPGEGDEMPRGEGGGQGMGRGGRGGGRRGARSEGIGQASKEFKFDVNVALSSKP